MKKYKFPVELTSTEINTIKNVLPYTMTSKDRLSAMVKSFNYVMENNIQGDFVECGVWRGGNLILLAQLLKNKNTKRGIYGFDTFEGMTSPTDHDVDYKGNTSKQLLNSSNKIDNVQNVWSYCSIENVKKHIQLFTNLNDINLIKGPVEKTLLEKNILPEKISILRLDTDWYESTKVELEILYPRLVKGGILIIDDYGHFKGCQKAVDEFFKNKQVFLNVIDYTGRLIVKHD
ncbi:MAG: macrocin O-methyltransferase [Euryarchaeota archaeon]|nr:macrocin O-methyltransferase [Euryarchaeota archaeon]|tara:strand:- start:1850 stop:2545 length:696 start_codon:yes stop_codon:yes gene_type:complete